MLFRSLNALNERHRPKFENLRNLVLVSEMFGVGIRDLRSNGYKHFKISDERTVTFFKKGNISWSDDDSQPEDEWLYIINFSTGPYFFGQEYLVDYFNLFFEELKNYGPAFSDSRNHSLYFRPDEARAVHEAYNGIVEKYFNGYNVAEKRARLEKLRAELEKLEEQE